MVRVGRLRLTTVQTDTTRIQTVYQPGASRRSSASKQTTVSGESAAPQPGGEAAAGRSEDRHGVVFPAELVRLLDRLEEEILADRVSSESRAWLAQCGLTVEQLARQVEPGIHTGAKSSFLPLRPPGPAAGAHQRRRQYGVERGI